MSAGHAHRRPNRAHFSEPNETHLTPLRHLMEAPSFLEMWRRPYRVTTTHQIPDSAGYSVEGDEYFVDAELYRAIISGTWTHPRTGRVHTLRVAGLTPQQFLDALLTHERIEKCLLDADNDINSYLDAHEMATCGEHEKVRADGAKPYAYEADLQPLIEWNQEKPLTDVPPNLGCAPLLDDPDAADRRALREIRRLGVLDAFKVPKASVRYSRSTGADRCGGCEHFNGSATQDLAKCDIVCGLVRDTRWCEKYRAGPRKLDHNAHARWRSSRLQRSVQHSS